MNNIEPDNTKEKRIAKRIPVGTFGTIYINHTPMVFKGVVKDISETGFAFDIGYENLRKEDVLGKGVVVEFLVLAENDIYESVDIYGEIIRIQETEDNHIILAGTNGNIGSMKTTVKRAEDKKIQWVAKSKQINLQ